MHNIGKEKAQFNKVFIYKRENFTKNIFLFLNTLNYFHLDLLKTYFM